MMFHPRRDKTSPSCPRTGKIGWATKVDAEMARANAKSNRSRSAASTHEKRSYVCPFCNTWHLTKQDKRSKRNDSNS